MLDLRACSEKFNIGAKMSSKCDPPHISITGQKVQRADDAYLKHCLHYEYCHYHGHATNREQ